LQLIGVTGTNGKTTSVILARHVLSTLWPMGAIGTLGAFDPAGAPVESEAGNLTTPGPIDLQATLAALVDRGAGGVAMEVSSHSLDQGRVEGLVFRAAIFTNLTRDHLDYHETFDAYFAAKAKLVGYLADAGLAVINADDAAWARLRRTRRRITFSATTPAADVTARDVRVDAKGARFTLVTTQGSHPVTLPLLGRFNVANATSDNPRTEDPERILHDVEAGMSGGRPHYRIADRRAAIAQALELARPGDTILLAGKGHETYQVIGTTKEPFDEREVVRSLGAN